MNTCVKCLISGRVQGVSFRAHTRHQALQFGLRGWVRNVPSGQVEVLACGPTVEVEKLIAWLWQGPAEARVADVRCEAVSTPTPAPAGFVIR
ncbi:MAG: Acylphosphatase [Chromatiales bacterium USCg_Taylor]|nr:MAG: Acylphosphatase [Chromatiales bacterium USCg_Taylor]